MSSNWHKGGPNLVPAYQMSGIPYVTSSVASEVFGPDDNTVSIPTKVSFPYVTKFITVRNTGINELRVGFSPNGVIKQGERLTDVNAAKATGGSNFFLIPTGSGTHGSVQTFEVRCKAVYFLSNATKNNDPTASARCTDFSLLAGLTTIDESVFPTLTGSVNGSTAFEGVG
jgi:hypothetical protein